MLGFEGARGCVFARLSIGCVWLLGIGKMLHGQRPTKSFAPRTYGVADGAAVSTSPDRGK
jgi:hypothetical protein